MFKRLYPSEDADNIYEIDFEDFYLNGYRAVLFDIDNTLVEHGAPATPKVIDFLRDCMSLDLRHVLSQIIRSRGWLRSRHRWIQGICIKQENRPRTAI